MQYKENEQEDERPSRLLENVNRQPYSSGPNISSHAYFLPKKLVNPANDGAKGMIVTARYL
jgi:hypothetical protein